MKVGDQIGPFPLVVTREQLVRYAGAADDYNPIHYDDEVARSFGLPGVIVHGMLNMGVVARIILEAMEEEAHLTDYHVRFRQMVQPGDQLLVTGTVTSAQGALLTINVNLSQEGQKPALTGQMTIHLGPYGSAA